jgi:peptidoglycan/LPS O-acetylase OafA/YrhL
MPEPDAAAEPSSTLQAAPPARIPELDGVRGIAILLVLVFHYAVTPLLARPLGRVAHATVQAFLLTWSGVDLFFVLSGFLIGGILLDQREAPRYFRAFFARRICRIFPLYFLALACFAALTWALGPLGRNAGFDWTLAGPMPAWSYATFTQNIVMAARGDLGAHALAVTWSLGVEEQFYLLLPFVIRFVPRRWLPAALVLLAAVGPTLRVAMGQRFEVPRFVITPCRLDSLMLGVLCAWMLRQPASRRWLGTHRGLLYSALAVLGLATLYSSYRPHPFAAFNVYPWRYTWMAVMFACFLLLAVVEGSAGGGPASALARNRVLRWCGGLAYGLYLIHQAVLGLAHGALLHQAPQLRTATDLAVTLGALGATLVLAAASWRWFEKPILALGQAVRYGEPAALPLRRAA